MTLTPEQFNKLATKDDLKELVTKGYLDKKIDKVLTAVDKITKKYDDHNTEHVSNVAAHDRMQGEINETRGGVGLKIKSQTVS